MTNSNEPPRRPARRQPTRRSTAPRTSVPSARDELERERELYSQHDPTASFMHERVQNKPAGQERGASSAFPAYAGAGNDHIAHSRVATNQPAQTNQGYTANGNMSNVSAWDQHASASASQRMPGRGPAPQHAGQSADAARCNATRCQPARRRRRPFRKPAHAAHAAKRQRAGAPIPPRCQQPARSAPQCPGKPAHAAR